MDQQPVTEVHLPNRPQSNTPQPVSKTNTYLIALACILILLVTGISSYFFIILKKHNSGQQSRAFTQIQSVPSPTSITPPVQEWETLESPYCGISVQYPSTWEATLEEKDGCIFSINSPDEEGSLIQILSLFYDDIAWEELLKRDEFKIATPITVAGAQGILMNYDSNDFNYLGENLSAFRHVYFHKGNLIAWVAFSGDVNNPETLKEFDRFISSIRLTQRDEFYNKVDIDTKFSARKANDFIRRSDVNAILNAIRQFKLDGKTLRSEFPTQPQQISKKGVDLCSQLVPTYLGSFPVDPNYGEDVLSAQCSGDYNTYYSIVKNDDGTITVSAPNAELGETISVSE